MANIYRDTVLVDVLKEMPLPANARGAEVGVLKGAVSFRLLQEFPGLTLWGVDPYRAWPIEVFDTKCMKDWDQAAWDKTHDEVASRANAEFPGRFHLMRTLSVDAAKEFEKGFFDFVFIDGNHAYEFVRDDIEAWWPLVREGGLLMGHDYGAHRVQVGVKRAVEEFLDRSGLKLHTGKDVTWWVFKNIRL